MTETEPFDNEIIAVTAALPGWTVRVQHIDAWMCDDDCEPLDGFCQADGVHVQRSKPETSPVAAWATVRQQQKGGAYWVSVEPVFSARGRMYHTTEYRRIFSDLGHVTKLHRATTIDVDVIPPTEAAS
ncbi:hypothetical protein ACFPH6_19590 [Streptomyces xiangluensis]|uniref:Uncharacterized protein n=1 Tax=Streptomyces xiangluensis TaxID=2665720 RepID=A0ABV8YPR8_9ACTN